MLILLLLLLWPMVGFGGQITPGDVYTIPNQTMVAGKTSYGPIAIKTSINAMDVRINHPAADPQMDLQVTTFISLDGGKTFDPKPFYYFRCQAPPWKDFNGNAMSCGGKIFRSDGSPVAPAGSALKAEVNLNKTVNVGITYTVW